MDIDNNERFEKEALDVIREEEERQRQVKDEQERKEKEALDDSHEVEQRQRQAKYEQERKEKEALDDIREVEKRQRQAKDEQERKEKEAEALQYFAKLDKNGDGYISKDELIFEVVLDQNNDGQVSDEEVNSRHENYDKETFVCSKEEIQKMIKHELRNKNEKSSRSVSTIISDLSSIIGQIFCLKH